MYVGIIYFLACEVNQRQGDFMDENILNKSCVIYLLTNKINLMKYVGKTTKKLRQRLYEHRCNKSNKNTYISHAINFYGWENFSVEILEECIDAKKLNEREIFWIAKLNCKALNGYNLTAGGEGTIGRKYSDETRAKISENVPKRPVRCIDTNEIFASIEKAAKHFNISGTEVWRVCNEVTIRANNLKFEYIDAPLSEEARLREAKENRKKVICVETGVIYLSIKDAARQTGIDRKYISRVCNGIRKIGSGYHWKFLDEESIQKPQSSKLSNIKKPVRCFETNIIYECINEASRQTGIDSTYIRRACTGERKSGGGYHWEFVK